MGDERVISELGPAEPTSINRCLFESSLDLMADEARRRWPAIRSIVMSGYAENVLMQEGRLGAGIRLLVKPFRKADLARMLRDAMAEADRSPA